MKGDIALAGFVLTAEEWEALDAASRIAADRGCHAARSVGRRAVAGAVPRGIRSDSRRRLTCCRCPETASACGGCVVPRFRDGRRPLRRAGRPRPAVRRRVLRRRAARPASTAGRSARRARRRARAARSTRPPPRPRRPGSRVLPLPARARARPRAGRCGRHARRARRRSGSRRARSTTARSTSSRPSSAYRRATCGARLEAKLGVSPVELAQSRRLALAKQLLQDTALPLTEIAFAAGFRACAGSTRCSPSAWVAHRRELRRAHGRRRGEGVTLRLDYRAPYDWDHMLDFLRQRAIPGVEIVERRALSRASFTSAARSATIEVRLRRRTRSRSTVSPELLPVLMPLVARVRRMFDLDARPDLIARVLGRDARLASSSRSGPACACRARSIRSKRPCARCSASRCRSPRRRRSPAGSRRSSAAARQPRTERCTHRFPTPAEVVAAGADRIGKLGLAAARARPRSTRSRGAIASGIRSSSTARASSTRSSPSSSSCPASARGPRTTSRCVRCTCPTHSPPPISACRRRSARSGAKAAEARAEAWRPVPRVRRDAPVESLSEEP